MNSSVYYKRKGNLTKSINSYKNLVKLVNLNKESLKSGRRKNKNNLAKDKTAKSHTIQHKSTKGKKLQKNRIKKEIERAKESGSKLLQNDLLYKYKADYSKAEKVVCKNPTSAGQGKVKNMLYIQNHEDYQRIMVDYEDKELNKRVKDTNDFKNPQSLLKTSSNGTSVKGKRTKTPID
jgi:glucan biosynthesis protein